MQKKISIPAEDTKENIKKIFNSNDKKKIKESNSNVKPINEINKKWDMNDKIIDLYAENIGNDQTLRIIYATILMVILGLLLLALVVIFILKGLHILDYSDTTFNLFITGGLLEVFALVRIIVKYLFKDNLTKALNTILENNNPIKKYSNNFSENKKINSTKKDRNTWTSKWEN